MKGYLNASQRGLVRFQLRKHDLRLPPVGGMVEVPAYGKRPARFVGHDRRGFFFVAAPAPAGVTVDCGFCGRPLAKGLCPNCHPAPRGLDDAGKKGD